MIPWTVAYKAPQTMEFSRQEYWSGLPFPSPRDFPDPGIELRSLALQADALQSEPPGKQVMLRILQARLQQYMNNNFHMFKLDLEKAEEPKINCQHLLDY